METWKTKARELQSQLDDLKGKSVIVVDDVITTRATMVVVCELIAPKVREITILALATRK